MLEKVNLAEKLAGFDEPFSPRIVGYYNDTKIQVAKTKGPFAWHSHPDTDDLFLVHAGSLRVELRDGAVELGEGELLVDEAHVLLLELKGTPNTGDADAEPAPEVEI
jgi:hypothetical protein